jgi:hypothetical protein
MLTTKFRIWFQNARVRPDWTGIELVDSPRYLADGCVEVTVKGNGHNLRRLIAKRPGLFASYLQMMPQNRQDNSRIMEPPPHPHRQHGQGEKDQEGNRIEHHPLHGSSRLCLRVWHKPSQALPSLVPNLCLQLDKQQSFVV